MMLTIALALSLAQSPEDAMRQVQRSHIEANVPADADFERLLQGDLDRYFKAKRPKPFKLTYEFLRRGPTQSGVSYPKFYLWVQVSEEGRVVEQGAVRIAAVEKKEFQITDFIGEPAIRSDPAGINRVFPALVCDTIKQRLGLAR